MEYRLSDNDLSVLDAMEQEGCGQEVLDTYWRYLSASMNFRFDTVVVTDAGGGVFEAVANGGRGYVERWEEFLGSEDAKFARFPTVDGNGEWIDRECRLICWTDGMVGIYKDQDAFAHGEGVMVLI
jgi:hypothetical protein